MSGRHIKWIHAARRHARRSRFPGYKMAALLVKGGRIISVGLNRTSPGVLKSEEYVYINHGRGGCQGVHAELDAILNTCDHEDLRGANLYVAGVGRCGGFILSKPCPECQKMLGKYELKSVYYHDKAGQVAALA